jgi:plastocyanin domain-containing protein
VGAFQQSGKVVTLPFPLNVEEGAPKPAPRKIPSDALRIRITQRGYEPARLEIPADRSVMLAFTREESPSCGAEVVFPSLGLRRAIPFGETVLVEVPAQPKSELTFSCGMACSAPCSS